MSVKIETVSERDAILCKRILAHCTVYSRICITLHAI